MRLSDPGIVYLLVRNLKGILFIRKRLMRNKKDEFVIIQRYYQSVNRQSRRAQLQSGPSTKLWAKTKHKSFAEGTTAAGKAMIILAEKMRAWIRLTRWNAGSGMRILGSDPAKHVVLVQRNERKRNEIKQLFLVPIDPSFYTLFRNRTRKRQREREEKRMRKVGEEWIEVVTAFPAPPPDSSILLSELSCRWRFGLLQQQQTAEERERRVGGGGEKRRGAGEIERTKWGENIGVWLPT